MTPKPLVDLVGALMGLRVDVEHWFQALWTGRSCHFRSVLGRPLTSFLSINVSGTVRISGGDSRGDMRDTRADLDEALQEATVPLVLPGPSKRIGTGFFVAPRLVVTCAHLLGEGNLPRVVHALDANHRPGFLLTVLMDSIRFGTSSSGEDLVLLRTDD